MFLRKTSIQLLNFRRLFCISSIIYFLFVCTNLIYGQQPKFDSVFYNTAVNIAGTNTRKALHIADSLYQNTPEKRNKLRALMLTADIYTKKGQINKAITYALKASLLAEETNNYEWIARISGFLSTQYRSTGLKSTGLRFLSKGMNAALKISDATMATIFQGTAYQEKAYYEMEDKAFQKAIASLKKAAILFEKLPDNPTKYFMLATNEEMLGKNNFYASNFDIAQTHYSDGLDYLKKASSEDSPLKGFIYDGLGKVFFNQKQYNKAHDYFLKAAAIAERVDFTTLKIEVYQDLSNYYDVVKDMPKYKHYNKLYNNVLQNQIKENKQSADKIVTTINNNAQKSSKNKEIYLYLSGTIIFVLAITFLLYGIQKKRERKKFERIVKLLEERNLQSRFSEISKTIPETAQKQPTLMMSPAVEELLVGKLKEFELGNKFTNNSITLSSLSTLLDTNSKYLSHVINRHKGKDFNSYINELRIFYIINKIKNDTVYVNYKISYLAQESGFSSHSKFSAVFKTIIGLPPTVFLEQYQASKLKEH